MFKVALSPFLAMVSQTHVLQWICKVLKSSRLTYSWLFGISLTSNVQIPICSICSRISWIFSHRVSHSSGKITYVDGKSLFKAILCGWEGSSANGGLVRAMEK